jgi:CRP-like cAMP-binding protein
MSHDMKVGRAVTGLPLLAGLDDCALDSIVRGAAIREWKAGSSLWRQGTPARDLYLILEGRVRILRTRNGRQYVVHHEEAGGTLGEVPLFDGGAYPATAVAASHVRCLVVPAAVLRSAMAADARLADRLLGRLSGRVRHLVGRLHDATVGTVRSRLAAHLLARATTSRTRTFTLAGTQAQVAEELGTVREVLTRELAMLRNTRVIQSSGRGRFELLDEAALERMTRE